MTVFEATSRELPRTEEQITKTSSLMNLRFFRSIIPLIASSAYKRREKFCIRLMRFSWIIPTAFWVEYYLNFSLICPSFLKLLGLQGQRHLRWELQLTSVNKSKLPNPKNVWSSHELCFIMRLTYLFDIHKTNGRRTLEYLITVHKHVRTELFHCHVEHSN